jgi:hypothetical protein
LTYNFIPTQNPDNVIAHRIDIENISFPRKSFQWKNIRPRVQNYVKTTYSMSKEEKEEKEDIEKSNFPLSYDKIIEREHQLDESKAPKWVDEKIKTK